tara:strand:+ start:151 stop:510 length:360 start_codon:yes stop_codon:yes gene_type:complete
MEIRRKATRGVKHKTPKISITYPIGQFRLYKKTLQLIKIDETRQALMFDIQKDHIIVKIEDRQNDNYHINSRSESFKTFSSKPLAEIIANQFSLNKNGIHLLDVEQFGKNFKLTVNNKA